MAGQGGSAFEQKILHLQIVPAIFLRTVSISPISQKEEKIQHRTIRFKRPWTNGMVERFNGKIKTKVFKRYLFADEEDLKEKLNDYLANYNFVVKLRQLNYQTPVEYLKQKYNYSIQCIVR